MRYHPPRVGPSLLAARRPGLRHPRPCSARRPETVQPVEEQVQPERERPLIRRIALAQVLVDVLDEVRVPLDRAMSGRALGSGAILSRLGTRRFVPFPARLQPEDLAVLRTMLETSAIRPVIDATYPLASTADALRRVEGHGLSGKVVITL